MCYFGCDAASFNTTSRLQKYLIINSRLSNLNLQGNSIYQINAVKKFKVVENGKTHVK